MPRAFSLVFSLLLVLPLAAAPIAVAPPQIVPDTTSGHSRPAVTAATNGSRFFVAWEDRLNPAHAETSSVRFRTYDASGAPLQPLPLPGPGSDSPSVFWAGNHWFVTSGRYLGRFEPVAPLPTLFGATISELGDTTGPLVGGSVSAWAGNLALVSNGWVSVITDTDGRVLRELPVAYAPLASAAGRFLAAGPNGGVFVIDTNGSVVNEVAVSGRPLAATAHGDEYAIVLGGTTVVVLDVDGNVKSAASYTADDGNAVSAAAIGWSGGTYVVAVAHGYPANRLCVFRAVASAVSQCTAGFPVDSVAIAANDTSLLVAWSQEGPTTGAVKTAFAPAGSLPSLDNATVATTIVQPQASPSMESDPNGRTIVWSEPDNASRAMIGGINSDGSLRAPRTLAAPATARVSLERGKTSTMAVWSTGGSQPEVFAQELNDSGHAGAPIPLGFGNDPSVAFDGDDWLVVWSDLESMPQVMSALIRGLLLPGPVVQKVSPSPGGQTKPVVASRGKDFLVVWLEYGVGLDFDAAFVDRNGFTASPMMMLAGTDYVSGLDLAANGDKYLLAVSTFSHNIGLTPTSTIPGIIVSGFPSGLPRVRPRSDGGFAILVSGFSPARLVLIDALANVTFDGSLPFASSESDFIERDGRIDVAYTSCPFNDPQLFFDSFALRRRIVA